MNPVVSPCYQKTGPRRYCWKGPFCRELFVQLLLLCLQLLIVLGSHPVCLGELPLVVSGPARPVSLFCFVDQLVFFMRASLQAGVGGIRDKSD